jgi:tetratricopeptide (TPR) repeat protein
MRFCSAEKTVPPKDSTSPKLVIIEGKDKGKVIAIEPGATVFGRTKGDIILQDARVSRSHLTLTYDERSGKLSFSDLKSLNGTLVNGKPAESGVLVDGDRLQVGNTLFDCQLSPATELAEIAPKRSAKNSASQGAENSSLVEVNESSASASIPLSSADTGGGASIPEFNENPEPMQQPLKHAPEPHFEESPARQEQSQSLFFALPATARRKVLLGALLIGGLYFLFPGSGSNDSADFHRDVASVRELEKAGKIDEAIQKAETLSKEYEKEAELQVTLGGLYTLQKRYEPAILAYRRAKEINPDHTIATVRLIALYLRTGLGKEAEVQSQDLDRFMREGVHDREFFIEAANLFLEFRQLTQSPEKALILSRALQNDLALNSSIGFKLEAQLMFQQNQNEEAMKVIEKGLKRDPQDEWLLENLAFAKLSQKDTPGATATVENWIQIHPKASKAYLVLAYLKYNEKNFLGALPPLQKIVQIANEQGNEPHLGEALHLTGQIYWQQGQTAEAKNVFQQSCSAGFSQACAHESLREPQSTRAPSPK